MKLKGLGLFLQYFGVVALCCMTQGSFAQSVKIGWEEWPPYQYQDESGQYTGIDLEIIFEAVEASNLSPEFVEIPWGRLLEDTKAGKMHVVTGASRTAEREEWAYFSEPYRTESVVLFVKRGESGKFNISDIADFAQADMQVGGVIGYYYGESYDALIKTPEFRRHVQLVRDGSLNFEKLKRGRIDGFLMDPFAGKNQILENGYEGQFEVHPIGQLYRDDIHFMISKKLPRTFVQEINGGLQKIKDNGVHGQIVNKYSSLD